MKSSFYIPLALALSLCLSMISCQKDNQENHSPLNVNLSVRYLAKGKAARAEAHLTTEDSLGKQTAVLSPSGVKANNKELSNKWLSDKLNKYQLEIIQEYESSVVFDWSTPQGKQRSDTLYMETLPELNLGDSIDTKKPLKINLKNSLLDSTESITLVMSEKESGSTRTISLNGPYSQKDFELDFSKENIQPGIWNYYFVKRKEEKINENAIFLQTSFEYYSFDAQVLIK